MYEYRHTTDAWTKTVNTHTTIGAGIPVAISILVIKHRKPNMPVLTNGHVMLALYDGVIYMYHTRSFSVTIVEIYISEVLIGIVKFFRRPGSRNAADQLLPGTLADIHVDTLGANSNIDDRGRYTDPRIPDIAIEYEFSGRKINNKDVFTCLMEAFMILSYDGDINFQALNAVGASGNAALNIHHTDYFRPNQKVTTGLVHLLAVFYFEKRRFEEIDSDMWILAPGYPWLRRAAG